MSSPEYLAAERVYIAFDYPRINQSEPQKILRSIEGVGAGIKVGTEIAASTGWLKPIEEVQDRGLKVFADAKLHDIGNTVCKTAVPILGLEPDFLNVHATSSEVALKSLVGTRDRMQDDFEDAEKTKLLGVTLLTDVENDEAFADYRRSRKKEVLHLADKVLDAGLDGVVCSPEELTILGKYARFDKLIRMVPAIRPAWSVADDQKNFTTPQEAIERGATHLVVGRPITQQYGAVGDSPMDALRAVVEEVARAL